MVPSPFDRELLLFVGKGGVGKTTASAAVALALAASGRRTLLVTVDPAQRLKDALGVPLGHRLRTVRPNLQAMMLDPERIIEEWVRENVPDQDLTKHPLYKYISNYMPGVNELLAIGQLIELRREKDFQAIVVDTAPTGDALSFLTTPLKVRDLLQESLFLRWAVKGYALYRKLARGGRTLRGLFRNEELPAVPEVDFEALLKDLAREVGAIHELLRDPRRTALNIVTHPEKLPVQESLDLRAYLVKELGIRPASIVVNRVPPTIDQNLLEALRTGRLQVEAALAARGAPGGALRLLEIAQFHARRSQQAHDQLEVLRRRFADIPRFKVPLQPDEVTGLEALETLWKAFEHEGVAA